VGGGLRGENLVTLEKKDMGETPNDKSKGDMGGMER